MGHNILILGASYGSLFGTKCAMAGHNATLVCRAATAALINNEGTEVRLPLKGAQTGTEKHAIRSGDLPARIDACTPDKVDLGRYAMVILAMQEPQYSDPAIRALMTRIAEARLPCLSLMNMPPLPYLKRFAAIDPQAAEAAFTNARLWDRFDPQTVSLCSPDPQAVRPADEPANVLQVNLATNFKAALFGSAPHNALLNELATDIDNVRLDGLDVPVKLRVHDSLFVPFAKWAMLLTGNYRCITAGVPVSIRDAVHGDPDLSRNIYACVESIVLKIGAQPEDLVPFDKYAAAALQLSKPSSAARAIASGAAAIERVDRLVQAVGRQHGITHPAIDHAVAMTDTRIAANRLRAA